MQPLNYKKAPITEAIIDLQIEMIPEIQLSNLSRFQDDLKSDYPKCDNLHNIASHIEIAPAVTTTTSQMQVGYSLSSSDSKQIVQTRLNGFTFSRLAPYDKWETFRDEARRLWDIYRKTTDAKTVSRVAVRYINRLDLPFPFDDFKEFLLTVPEVSPRLPQALSDYFMQLKIPQNDLNAMLILNEAIIPPDKENVVSVLLDIDLFCNVNFSSEDNAYWDTLEKFRLRKNEVFEACITDKMRELLH